MKKTVYLGTFLLSCAALFLVAPRPALAAGACETAGSHNCYCASNRMAAGNLQLWDGDWHSAEIHPGATLCVDSNHDAAEIQVWQIGKADKLGRVLITNKKGCVLVLGEWKWYVAGTGLTRAQCEALTTPSH